MLFYRTQAVAGRSETGNHGKAGRSHCVIDLFRVSLFWGRRSPGVRHNGGADGFALAEKLSSNQADSCPAVYFSGRQVGPGGREDLSRDHETGGQGGLYVPGLLAGVYVQAQPSSCRSQQRLYLLFDEKDRRDSVYGRVCYKA